MYILVDTTIATVYDAMSQVLALAALFAPLVLVPFAFRMAGGLISQIHGAVHGRIGQRGLEGLGGKRAAMRKDLHERRMAGQTRLGTGRTGSLYRGIATLGTKEGWSPTGRGRRRFAQYDQLVKDRAAAEMLEKGGARAFNDDDASRAAANATSARDFVNQYTDLGHSRQEAQAAMGRAEVATGAKMGSDSMAVAALKYRIGMSNTAYAAGPDGLRDMQTEVQGMVHRGLITTHDAAGWMKANKGRADYSANAYQATVEFLEGDQTARQQIEGAFAGADPRDILSSHQRGIEAFAEQARINMQAAVASGDALRIQRATVDAANIHNALSSTSPNKANEFADEVFSQGSGLSSSLPGANPRIQLTVRELIDEARSRPQFYPAFHDRSREYASGAAAAGAGAGVPPPPPPPPAGGATPPSDKRLKTNIKHLQTLDNGIKLYSFRYIWGGPVYVGVMAQDLLGSHPEAVIIGQGGYYCVDYSLLGIKMVRLEKFIKTESNEVLWQHTN